VGIIFTSVVMPILKRGKWGQQPLFLISSIAKMVSVDV